MLVDAYYLKLLLYLISTVGLVPPANWRSLHFKKVGTCRTAGTSTSLITKSPKFDAEKLGKWGCVVRERQEQRG